MTENDSPNLKEELKNIEEKITKLLNVKESKLKKEISNINIKINDIFEKNRITIENYSSQNVDHGKILEFEAFKNKADAMIIAHEVKINNTINDFTKFQTKYDKIITDNLLIPGLIGRSCQFRNLKEYINNNIYTISRLKSENEQIKKETKETKNKIETLMKQMIVLNDASVERCIEYIDNKLKDMEGNFEGKFNQFNDKFKEIRVLFGEFENKIDGQISIFKSEILKILNLKEELIKIMNDKVEEIQKYIDDVHKKVVLNIQDIGILKKKFNNINDLNNYYKKNYSSKRDNFFKKKEIINTFQGFNKSNMMHLIKNREGRDYLRNLNYIMEEKDYIKKNNYTINTLSANIKTKPSEFVALNFDVFPDNIINNNINTIKSSSDLNKINRGNIVDFKKLDLNKKEKIIKSEFASKIKNFIPKDKYIKIQSPNYKNKLKISENNAKTDSFENLLMDSKIMPMITEPFLLDRKILSDTDLKAQKEKKAIKKEIIKKHMQNNLLNLRQISGNNPLDLYNYSTSVPKLSLIPKKIKNKLDINTKKKSNKFEDNKNKNNSMKSQTLNNLNLNFDKNFNKNYKLVNLELKDNESINPDTNNGAYVLANKQIENGKNSKLNITPTSYINVYDATQKSSRLINMTFKKEEPKLVKNEYYKTLNK